jgi:hypothetical protein
MIKEVQEIVEAYPDYAVELVNGLDFNQYETLRTIEFYHNSRFLNGQKDALNRDKPFYNINRFRLNVAIRATDFDTKDIQIEPDREADSIKAMLLREAFHDWMREVNFAKVLNEAGVTRAKYGGVIFKKEKSNPLTIGVVDWRNIITDPTDLLGGTIIEIHYMSPKELRQKGWYSEEVQELLTTERKNAIGDTSEATTDKVRIFEIYGCFEDYDYELYKCIVADGMEEPLYAEKVSEIPYKYLPWERMPGRDLGWGVIEDGFEAQVWSNDAVIKERDMLEFASKIIFKTNDDSVEDNVLTDIDNGHIVHLADGKDFNILNTVPSSLPAINAVLQKWDQQYERVSNTYDSVTGASMPSRTPFRTTAMLQQQGESMFQYRMEEFGIFLKEVMYDWIIPYLIKKLNNGTYLRGEFSDDELKMIDQSFREEELRKLIGVKLLTLKPVDAEQLLAFEEQIEEMKPKTKRRFIAIPKDYFKDIKYKIEINTTGESVDKAAMLESLNNILIAVAQNPQIITDPTLSKLFNKIIEMANIDVSTSELSNAVKQTQNTLPAEGNNAGATGVLPANPQGQVMAPNA